MNSLTCLHFKITPRWFFATPKFTSLFFKGKCQLRKYLRKLRRICALAWLSEKIENFIFYIKHSIFAANYAAKYVNGISALPITFKFEHKR